MVTYEVETFTVVDIAHGHPLDSNVTEHMLRRAAHHAADNNLMFGQPTVTYIPLNKEWGVDRGDSTLVEMRFPAVRDVLPQHTYAVRNFLHEQLRDSIRLPKGRHI